MYITVLLFTTPFIVQIRGGQLHELWKPHSGSQLRPESQALRKYNIFSLFDGVLFLFIQLQ